MIASYLLFLPQNLVLRLSFVSSNFPKLKFGILVNIEL